MAKEDKIKALEAAISNIERSYGKGAIMKLGDPSASLNVETIPTGSISLDVALGMGGVPKGRIIEIYGPESSGKTTVALHMVAEVQKRGGIAGFIDAEHALDPVYARNIGVDIDKDSTDLASSYCGDVDFICSDICDLENDFDVDTIFQNPPFGSQKNAKKGVDIRKPSCYNNHA